MNKQTEALKMAIEALERVDRWLQERHMGNLTPLEKDALQACKEALEQPTQEPVALVYSMQDGYVGQMVVKNIPHKTKLYTHPASSWQGLSDDDCLNIWDLIDTWEGNELPHTDIIRFAHAIEQVLKEKNT